MTTIELLNQLRQQKIEIRIEIYPVADGVPGEGLATHGGQGLATLWRPDYPENPMDLADGHWMEERRGFFAVLEKLMAAEEQLKEQSAKQK